MPSMESPHEIEAHSAAAAQIMHNMKVHMSAGGCGADYAQHECSRGIEGKGALTYLSIVPVAFSPGTNMPAGYEGRELPLVHRFRLPFTDRDGIKVPERVARSEAKCMYGSPSVAGSYCWPTLHSKSRSEIKQQTRL